MIKIRFKRSYFAFPYFIVAGIFVVVPLLTLFVLAFKGSDGGFTFGNFIDFFTRKNTFKVLGRSAYVAFMTTFISLLIAFPVALILASSKYNKNAILILLFVIPMWINSLLRTYAIKSVFDLMNISNSYVRVIIANVYDFFPFMLLPLYSVLVNMDKSLLEASTDLGGNSVLTFLKVKLPLAVPGIVSGILMVFMPTLSSFAIADIVSRGTDMYLFGHLINNQFNSSSTYSIGSAYSFILLLMIVIVLFIANKLSGGRAQAGGIAAAGRGSL